MNRRNLLKFFGAAFFTPVVKNSAIAGFIDGGGVKGLTYNIDSGRFVDAYTSFARLNGIDGKLTKAFVTLPFNIYQKEPRMQRVRVRGSIGEIVDNKISEHRDSLDLEGIFMSELEDSERKSYYQAYGGDKFYIGWDGPNVEHLSGYKINEIVDLVIDLEESQGKSTEFVYIMKNDDRAQVIVSDGQINDSYFEGCSLVMKENIG